MSLKRRRLLPSGLSASPCVAGYAERGRPAVVPNGGLPSIRVAPLRFTTREDVLDLVADLRDALRRSERTGAQHLVFRKSPDSGAPGCHLAIEIQVPPRFRGVRKKGDR